MRKPKKKSGRKATEMFQKVSAHKVLKAVADAYGISIEDVRHGPRQPRNVDARTVAIGIYKEITDLSCAVISGDMDVLSGAGCQHR